MFVIEAQLWFCETLEDHEMLINGIDRIYNVIIFDSADISKPNTMRFN